MKKLLIIITLILGAALASFRPTDDTSYVQGIINTSGTLPRGTYNITHLSLVNNLNMNGSTFNFGSTSGACVTFNNAGKTLSNGEIVGVSNTTDPSGAIGIDIKAINATVSHVYVHRVAGSGILVESSGANIIDSKITNIGYLAVFFVVHVNTSGFTMNRDTLDRSMIPAAGQGITQPAFAIRGDATHQISNASVKHCFFIMPHNPHDDTAEGIEVRYANHCNIDSNTFTGGSLGLSIVRSTFITAKANIFRDQNREAIEYANAPDCKDTYSNIDQQLNLAYLLDGYPTTPYSVRDTIDHATVTGCAGNAIELFRGTSGVVISNSSFTSTNNKPLINLIRANAVKITNTTFNGAGLASTPFKFDKSSGDFTVTGGTLSNFTYKAFDIYSDTATFTDNIKLQSVTLTSVPAAFSSNLSNGAKLGTNIFINNAPSSDKFSGSYTQVLSPVLNAKHDTTITGKWLYSTTNTPCLTLTNCYNVTIINCIVGQSDSLGNNNSGIYTWNCKNITIKNCYIKNVWNGVLATYSQTVKVDTCQILNVKGGSFIRFANVTGLNNRIIYNRCESIDRLGFPKDGINIYRSSGTATSPILIDHNMIRCNLPTNINGGGILLGDNQGSYQVASNNSIVSPGSYGIGIAGGQHNTLISNKIYSPSHAGSTISNVAITVSNVTPIIGLCNYNTVRGNIVNWYSDRLHGTNNAYNPGSCYTVTGLATLNKFGAAINSTILPTQLLTTANPIP